MAYNADDYDYPEYGDMVPHSEEELLVRVGLTTTTTTTPAPPDYPEYDDYNTDDGQDRLEEGPEAGVRVMGGTAARPGQFPHQASIQHTDGPKLNFCGGAIIHPLLILTAAHCLTGLTPDRIRVVTGQHRLEIYVGTEQFRNVTELLVHENWNNETWDNDIALLALNQPLKFDEYTRPIEILQGGVGNNLGAWVSGWATAEYGSPHKEQELQFSFIKFQNRTTCAKRYSRFKNITDSMICAGGITGFCLGDGGGPLTCLKRETTRDESYLCGLPSFGLGCGNGVPAVYTNVSKYYGWITKHMATLGRRHSSTRAMMPSTMTTPAAKTETITTTTAETLRREILKAEATTAETETTIITTTSEPDAYPEYKEYSSETESSDDIDGTDGYDDEPEFRIMGGRNASKGEFPHQVSLQLKAGGHFCGASVIHPLLLVTAAHCLLNTSHTDILAVTGAHNLKNYSASEQFREVRHAIIHENWDNTTWDNDIAILVLNESLVRDMYTKPIDILKTGTRGKKGAYVSGWGKMQEIPEIKFPDVLRSAWILFTPNRTKCVSQYANMPVHPKNITDNMICAGGVLHDSCEGDSGGPLTCYKRKPAKDGKPDEFYLCGIVSFGAGCNAEHPGIYTDVSKYYGWIRKHMRLWWWQHWMTSVGKPLRGDGQCRSGLFRCENSGTCIPDTFRCDGTNDCDPLAKAEYDEKNCTCPSGQFHCADNSGCIPDTAVCDGNNECEDGSDEENCLTCPPSTFRCADNSGCIAMNQVCDGNNECEDGSDEINCPH